MPQEIARRVSDFAESNGPDPRERGAVWTYLMMEQPFGSWTERVMRGLRRRHEGS
jgi:hypothetical protein